VSVYNGLRLSGLSRSAARRARSLCACASEIRRSSPVRKREGPLAASRGSSDPPHPQEVHSTKPKASGMTRLPQTGDGRGAGGIRPEPRKCCGSIATFPRASSRTIIGARCSSECDGAAMWLHHNTRNQPELAHLAAPAFHSTLGA
jgi:hypothetical protein